MIEALRVLAGITDYTDEQLEDIVHKFGRACLLYRLNVPAASVLQARKELAKVKDHGDSAVSAANIVACAEAFVDVIDTLSLQGAAHIPEAPEKFLALKRAIDNMRGHRRE